MNGGGESPAPSTRKAFWRQVNDGLYALVNEQGRVIVYGAADYIDEAAPEDLAEVYMNNDQIAAAESLIESPLYTTGVLDSWGVEKVEGVYNNGGSFELTMPATEDVAPLTYSMDLWADPAQPLTPSVEFYG